MIYFKKIITSDDFIIIRFSNDEIKILKPENVRDIDKHTQKITKKNIWNHIKYDDFSIYWIKYNIFGQPYEIGADNIYKLAKKPTKAELVKIIEYLNNKNKIKFNSLYNAVSSLF
jgi:hypothetical protein